MTENERVRAVRKSVGGGMTMEAFGKKVGVSKGAISRVESGSSNVSDQMRAAICMAFHVNEDWLRDGVGEMFAPEPIDMIGRVAREYGLDAMDEEILRQYASLPDEVRNVVKKAVLEIASKNSDQKTDKSNDIEEELADYRRQLKEENNTGERSSASQNASAG